MEKFTSILSEDKKSLTAQVKIFFGQCGSNKQLNFSQLMEFCANYVTDLYTQQGYDRQFLFDNGYIQMVSRSSIHINALPTENQVINITVREEKPEGFQLMRYYKFCNDRGEVLVEGKSYWVIVEPQNHNVVSPPNFKFLINSDIQTPFEKKPGKIRVPESLEKIGEQKILLSHLDPNGHLTNAKYINFALDFLPEEYQNKTFTDFRLNFSKEITKGQIMHVFACFDDENKRIIVVGKKDAPELPSKMETSFECELFY